MQTEPLIGPLSPPLFPLRTEVDKSLWETKEQDTSSNQMDFFFPRKSPRLKILTSEPRSFLKPPPLHATSQLVEITNRALITCILNNIYSNTHNTPQISYFYRIIN